MALNMNSFSDSFAARARNVNGTVSASVGVAFCAGIVSALLFAGPNGTPSPMTAAAPSLAETCVTQTWPHRDQKCRDAEAAERKLRDVRIVSTDKSQPPRVVKSAVADEAPAKAAPPLSPEPVANGHPQYAATWLMGVERMPSHATLTPPIASLSLASANLPLPAVTPEQAQASQPAQAAAPVETVAVAQVEPVATAMAPQQKRSRTAGTRAAAPKNSRMMTLVRTYEFADGRQVTIRRQIRSGEDRPGLEADGVLSEASSRNARLIRDDD